MATGVTFLVLLAVAALLVQNQQRTLDAAVDAALASEIDNLQRDLAINFGRGNRRPRQQVSIEQLRRFVQSSNNNFQLIGQDGRVILGVGSFNTEIPILTGERLDDDSGTYLTISDLEDKRFRVVSSPVGDGTLVVGYSLADVDEAQRSLRQTLIFTLPALALLLGLLIWFFVGRALAPVERMRREVDGISARDLDSRVSTPATTELSSLASTMNRMLGRIEDSLAKQQQFVSDASHELRSPLTGIRGQLEVNIAHPEAPGREESEREMLEETIRMQTLVEDLLALARSDQGAQQTPMALVDLDDLVSDEVRRQRRSSDKTINARLEPVQVLGNSHQLTRVVRNLLENANRHAESSIEVSVVDLGDAAHLVVSDDGPGVPEEMRDGIFERFTRSDEARDRDSGGSGLGLAICQTIAHAHDGTIELEPPSRFVVKLPAN